MNFKLGAIDLAGVGKMYHRRQPMEIDKQTVVRPNRDTLHRFVAPALVEADADYSDKVREKHPAIEQPRHKASVIHEPTRSASEGAFAISHLNRILLNGTFTVSTSYLAGLIARSSALISRTLARMDLRKSTLSRVQTLRTIHHGL
jgi:hypothetical protein